MKNLLFIPLIFLVSCKKENIQHFQTQKIATTIADPGIDPLAGSIQTHIVSDVFIKGAEIITYDNGIKMQSTQALRTSGLYNLLISYEGRSFPALCKKTETIGYTQLSYQSTQGKEFYSFKINPQGQVFDLVYSDKSIALMVQSLFPDASISTQLTINQCMLKAMNICYHSFGCSLLCGSTPFGFIGCGGGWLLGCKSGKIYT